MTNSNYMTIQVFQNPYKPCDLRASMTEKKPASQCWYYLSPTRFQSSQGRRNARSEALIIRTCLHANQIVPRTCITINISRSRLSWSSHIHSKSVWTVSFQIAHFKLWYRSVQLRGSLDKLPRALSSLLNLNSRSCYFVIYYRPFHQYDRGVVRCSESFHWKKGRKKDSLAYV